MDQFRIVIPARFASTRLPGKVLLDLAGKPLLEHVWLRAMESGACDVVIATDDDKVIKAAEGFGADVALTSAECSSGTDRVAEICHQRNWGNDIPVVNVQGDAPLIPPTSIQCVAGLLIDNPSAAMATLCTILKTEEEYLDPNVVKVVFNDIGKALYFSRSPIPAIGHNHAAERSFWGHRHLGLYAYRVDALKRLSDTPPCELELTERLEQLRAQWLGMDILIAVDESADAPDVDTEEDIRIVEKLLLARD
jgi:3-deoxy-manno-octulosonate cytidylyltransferase (CMP-KDO synthetase)